MNYYLVNYLVLDNKKILENERVFIPLHNFANISDFKHTIVRKKNLSTDPQCIVIKSYKQVSMDEFNSSPISGITLLSDQP